jgi:RNA polymerase sigma factor (sigma-70 family)
MHNSWLEECRRRRRRPVIAIDEVELALSGAGVDSGDPAEELERREAARSVLIALGGLGDRAANIVVLRRMCGFSPDEVCQTLGVSRRTYRAEHARAMNELQTLVERPAAERSSTAA